MIPNIDTKTTIKHLSRKIPGKVISKLIDIKKQKKDSITNKDLKKFSDKIYLKNISTSKLKEEISVYNRNNYNSLKWSEFKLLWNKDNNLIIWNHKWELELLEITLLNSRSILNYIKENDRNWEYDSYDLRNEIMHIDDSIKSFEVFTIGNIPTWKYEAKDYLKDEKNWLPKRINLQNKLYSKYYQEAVLLSDRIWNENPRVICIKWNTAVWKTYTLRKSNNQILQKYNILDINWKPTWALNPDLIKASIRNYDRSWDIDIKDVKMKHTISDCQAHIEWWIINDRIIRKLFEEKRSLVLDKRFVDIQSIQKTVTSRMWDNYSLTIIDIWWDFKDSLERTFKRDVLWNNAIVPYEKIEEWYIQTTTNREYVAKMRECNEYFLFYNWKLIAEAKKWDLVKHDFLIYNRLVHLEATEELDKLRNDYKDKINTKVKNWK